MFLTESALQMYFVAFMSKKLSYCHLLGGKESKMSYSCTYSSGLRIVLSGQSAFCVNLCVEKITDHSTIYVWFWNEGPNIQWILLAPMINCFRFFSFVKHIGQKHLLNEEMYI